MIAFLIFLCLSLPAQNPALPTAAGRIAAVHKLYAENKWAEIVRSVPAAPDNPAELELYRGLALAHLERWEDAKAAFEAGLRKEPRNERFLVELAGVAYKEGAFSQARTDLKRALSLNPGDSYARDFLATLYFLQGNLEAALLHWNRLGKPRVTEVRLDPEPKVRASLLDRAFAFSPLSVLRLDELRTTEARLRNLEIFPRYWFELEPAADDAFAVTVQATERNGWGDSKLDALVSLFRGLPYQTIYPEYFNLYRSAINMAGRLRWDAQKRRLTASVSFPLEQNPKWRFRAYFDGRNENWDISRTFQAAAAPVTALKLWKEEAGLELRSVVNGCWAWWGGVSFAHRAFQNFAAVLPPAQPFFTDGFSLESRGGLDHQLFRSAERRVTVDTGAAAHFGKFFAQPLGAFGKVEASLAFRWFPMPQGEDYEMNARFRVGRIFGEVPFDELYILGVERDNDLWLRGMTGTRDGKKGAAPMGRYYVLWNWESDKIAYRHTLFTVKLGPFLDVGRIRDPSQDFVSPGWLWDPGVQCKVEVLNSFRIVLSYGRDLHSGRHALYASVAR